MIELIPQSYVARVEPNEVFGRRAPLQVDLGCGDGLFLCALAERMPEVNFLGIERMAGRVRSATRKAARIGNVRVLRMETLYAVRYLLPPRSVDVFHLLFPDPWPKRRHHRRRVVTPDFLSAISTALVDDGLLRIVTDQSDYFTNIRRAAEQSDDLLIANRNGADDFPSSTFEQRFQRACVPIYRLGLQKVSPVI